MINIVKIKIKRFNYIYQFFKIEHKRGRVGKGEWNIPTSLPVLEDQNLEKYVSKLNYILIDLNKVSDDELINEAYIDFCFTSAVIAMKHVHENIEKIKAVL